MIDLNEIEAIKRLKYKYFRCLDSKKWDELIECFTPDAKSSFSSGAHSYQGREEIIEFFKEGLSPTRLSMHQGHHPEIEITSDITATGIWALEDYLIDTVGNWSMRGAAFYHDDYIKIEGQWKIKSTGYDRIFEEFWSRGDSPSLRLLQNMFEEPPNKE